MPTQRDVINTILAEAGNSPEGMAAVANVINNRANAWGMTPAQVIAQPNQFEGYSNPSPGGLANQQNPTLQAQAQQIWNGIQSGQAADPTQGGLNYYGSYIAPPSWARDAVANGQTANIGGNVFLLGSGTVPPQNIPAVGSDYANTSTSAPTPATLSPDLAALQQVTNPGGNGVDWNSFYNGLLPASSAPTAAASGYPQITTQQQANDFYNGLLPASSPTPLASGPASGSSLYGDFAALGMQQPTAGSSALSDYLAANPSYTATPTLGGNNSGYPQMDALYPSSATADSGATALTDRNASGSPDDRMDSSALLSSLLSTSAAQQAPTIRQVQTVPVDPATGQPVIGAAAPTANGSTAAQSWSNLINSFDGGTSIDSSALPSNGFFTTGQGIAGTAQLPANYQPPAGTVPSMDSVPDPGGSAYNTQSWQSLLGTPTSSSGASSGSSDAAQSWSDLINSFNNGGTSIPYADGTMSNSKDQSQLDPGSALSFNPTPAPTIVAPTTQQISVQQLNPAYTSWLNSQNSAINGVEGVASPSLDANGNVVLPSSYLGAPVPAPPQYLSVLKTVAAAPSLGIAAAAPTPAPAAPPVMTPQQYQSAAAAILATQPNGDPNGNVGGYTTSGYNLMTGGQGGSRASNGQNSGGSLSGGDGT